MNKCKEEARLKFYQQVHGVDMDRVACIILGGGKGTRLFPLTETRCKPAVHFGGNYRLIDVPISNAVNSGCFKIVIITQFLSSSIHKHILQTFQINSFSNGFLDVLPAEQKSGEMTWFEGTADAVRKTLHTLVDLPVDYFLVLSGDQLYHLDFRKVVAFAEDTDASVVVASLPVEEEDAKRMGVMHVNQFHEVVDFHEKPQDPTLLQQFRMPEELKERMECNEKKTHLASMGIYLFKRDLLIELLEENPGLDFGKDLIPEQVQIGGVYAYLFDDYWEDIGTIGAYHKANIALTQENSHFDLYDEDKSIYHSRSELPGPKFSNAKIESSVICEGAKVGACEISRSIIGPRSVIRDGVVIKDSYLIGNDHYKPPVKKSPHYPEKLEIGEGARIEKAIIDRNAQIGKRVKLINKNKLDHYDSPTLYVRDGVIVVTSGAFIPDDFEF